MTITAPPAVHRTTRSLLRGLLGTQPRIAAEHTAVSRHDVVARAAMVDVYEFTSVDYPGAGLSEVFDTDGTTAVGGFIFAPTNASSLANAFTVAGGFYKIFSVPNSAASVATGINTSGLIVGVYQDLAGSTTHGFSTSDGSTFTDIDFPGGKNTQVIDVNDTGDVVGTYNDAANVEHGFVSSGGAFKVIDVPGGTNTAVAGINANGDIVGGYSDATGSHGFLLSSGVFTPINFPLASSTTAWGINDDGDIAGVYTDTAGTSHGFVYADKNFSTVDVAGASGTQLTRIKNSGQVSGFYIDALSENHGVISR